MLKKVYASVLLTASLFACSSEEVTEEIANTTAIDNVAEVSTITVEHRPFTPKITVVGSIQAAEEIVLSAEVVAPVKMLHVREGQKVLRGDLLLELDSEKLQLSLTRAKKALEQSQSRLQESADNLTRRKELAEQKTLSQELLDSSRHGWQRAKAAVAEAEAAVRLAQRNLTDARILSPVNGVIDEHLVEVGEAVQEGQNLLSIQATDQLEVKTFVSERDIHLIRENNEAQVLVANWPQDSFAATVLTVGIAGDSRTGNFPVTLLITASDNTSQAALRPGMTATVNIRGETTQAELLIPESALIDHQRQRVVFVVENNKAVLRQPRLQVGLGDQVKVISGLQPGEQLVINSNRPLSDGMSVKAHQ